MYKLQKELIAGEQVELELHYTIENDSFDHEFGTKKYDDHAVLEDVKYDHANYSFYQQAIIDKWIQDNWHTLESGIDIEEDDNFPDPDERYQDMRDREMRDLDRYEP